MPEPTYSDLVNGEVRLLSDEEPTRLISLAADRQASAAYWQGRCETLEQSIAEMKESHQREIDSIIGANDITIGYLKDRLNRLEVNPD